MNGTVAQIEKSLPCGDDEIQPTAPAFFRLSLHVAAFSLISTKLVSKGADASVEKDQANFNR
jgi:hypothetical protein